MKVDSGVRVKATVDLLCFMMFQERHSPWEMWGGVKVKDAVDAMCLLLGITREQAAKVAFQEDGK